MSRPDSLPNHTNLAFVEALLTQFQSDPDSVEPRWRRFFETLRSNGSGPSAIRLGPSFRPASIFDPGRGRSTNGRASTHDLEIGAMQDRVDQMVRAYRVRGHMIAHLDPLLLAHKDSAPELDPKFYGFTDADLERPFSSRTIGGPNVRTLGEILERLWNTYCRFIGVQFMHIDDLEIRHWLQDRMEGCENRINLSRDIQLRILTWLTEATVLEEFIQKKFIGAKSFSLEGAESLIPLLDLAIEKAGEHRIDEIVVGMAHRGRLNVLANIMGKSARQIFREFADTDASSFLGRGDVKYHMGYHTDWMTACGHSVHLALCFNPSHLEFVNPVAAGRLRAKQDRLGDLQREKGMLLLIHGDAAFAGEGIVQETLNLSELRGYTTGGALHVIVNNQIGFTTDTGDARSSPYASDVAKMLQSPIFHVNGENPEAVAQVITLAMEFRRRWKRDAVIDMYCYRRRGHNEGDEPAYTQPEMYRVIRDRPPVRETYLEYLLELGEITREEADRISDRCRNKLEQELSGIEERPAPAAPRPSILGRVWAPYRGGPDESVPEPDTGVPRERLTRLSEAMHALPKDFQPHPKIVRLLETRQKMGAGHKPLDWPFAELLALATLATEGTRVRMSGQDVRRGTFSQRHAVLRDVETNAPYPLLQHLSEKQAPVEIFNSPLSENGVLGFEYGYSIACPDGLVVWEAQFGDFVNAAQVIIDQFLTSAEDKWFSLSGLVLLLPHGFEGQGPEHSSARLERFLTLAAEDNIQVVYPTTPAQHFHLLRRQVLRPWRKPLIVFTPKSLLRHPKATSQLEDLAQGRFQRILPDTHQRADATDRVLLCSGKIYYDLVQRREESKRQDVAIVRVEQLYPLSREALLAALRPYAEGTPVVWVQEEPENMGAWRYMKWRFGDKLAERGPFRGVYRPESASPATGSGASHRAEQHQVVDEAFGELRDPG